MYNNRDQSDNRFGSNFFTNDVFINYPTTSIYLYTGDDDLEVSDFSTTTSKGVFEIPEDHTDMDSILVYKWNTASLVPSLTTFKIGSLTEPTHQFFCVGPNGVVDAYETDSFNLFPGNLPIEVRNGFPPGSCEDLFELIEENAPLTITVNIGYGHSITLVILSAEEVLSTWCDECNYLHDEICNIDNGTGGTCEEECNRDCRDKREQLVKYRFNYQSDLDRTCSWTRTWCRFSIFAVHATNPLAPSISNVLKQDRARRRDLKGWNGNWWTPETTILFLDWDLDIHSDPVKYSWVYLHPKNGKKITHSIGYSGKFKVDSVEQGVSGSTSSEITKKDIPCAEEVVYYCDPADGDGSLYNTGVITFRIKESQ